MLLVCPAAGLMIGSLFATLRTMGGDLAPQGRVTQMMSWLNSIDIAGGVARAAVFAHIADAQGSRTALALIPGLLLVATMISPTAHHRDDQPKSPALPQHLAHNHPDSSRSAEGVGVGVGVVKPESPAKTLAHG
ncbi:hypothetical protein [Micromonospora sp. WMMD975]|uniref:hypothetical protein n=1 Tax=Micromonospora sp. WMMD975 TaxID=3016087 RepID=UPI00249B1BC6|nr:hypothetical protein [Micromonospora sp. WMMD975]WFE30982.1 hypothetical protein O7613_15130 [Micromonospora sp. WMMD975]